MKIKHLWNVLFIVSISFYANAQNKNWKKISGNSIAQLEKTDRSTMPKTFSIFQMDLKDLTAAIQTAPNDLSARKTTAVVSFPTSENTMERFEIYQAPVMSAKLSEKYPQITSYIGKSTEDPSSIIRFSITPFGLQAVHYSEKAGTSYIDTYTKDQKNYIYYNRNSLPESQRTQCLVDENSFSEEINLIKNASPKAKTSTARVFREYRMAMACTIEYAKFHLDQATANNIPLPDEQSKKAVVLSAMVATMTRVNFIYERDLSIRMTLIDNNDILIFIDSDNFSNTNANQLIGQSQQVINAAIGNDNYDIGHTVSTGGGGLAQLQTPCNPYIKAMGITGSPNPIGDAYDVDFVAHEVGHQFGAFHTFNSNCSGNVQTQTAVETGSGTSIMGYAGVCPPNVQQNSDPFFHSVSIAQINDFIIAKGDCSENTAKATSFITVNAGTDYTIPNGTPFKLTATATSDTHTENATYSWEQIDRQSSIQPPVSTAVGGPAFRNFAPTATPVRYFPKFANVLAGTTSTWEVLPTVARNLNFSVIVRDNNLLLGGQTDTDQMAITVANAGPFTVTSPNSTDNQWKANATQTVTWDVAGTTVNGIDTSLVNILFSADNGQTFSILKANTANDGSEAIIAPDYNSTECRILIEPVGNIYYALSTKFEVAEGTTAGVDDFGVASFTIYPNPTADVFTVQFQSNSTEDISIQIHDLRGRLISNQSYKNTSSTFQQEINLNAAQSGIYLISVQDGNHKEVKKLIKK